jgi:hypothetical protein
MLTELDKLPKDIKPREIISIWRHGEVFNVTWRRGDKMYGVQNVSKHEAFPIILACKDEIRARKNPEDRVEHWEARDEEGNFSYVMYDSILKSRITDEERANGSY